MRLEHQPNNFYALHDCVLCGGSFDAADDVIIALIDDAEEVIGDVCNDCIRAGPAEAAFRLRRRAGRLRQHVDEMDVAVKEIAAATIWPVPTDVVVVDAEATPRLSKVGRLSLVWSPNQGG